MFEATDASDVDPLEDTSAEDGSLDHRSVTPETVTAIVGGVALIPCNITASDSLLGGDDFITLILWYKENGGGAPIYTVDARTHPVETARHFPSQFVEGRSSFDLAVQPMALFKLSSIGREDDGLYKCRVDYRRGRTMHTSTVLSVVVPPERLYIMDEVQRELKNSKAGPFEEGSNLVLKCRAEGGRPPPLLYWFKDGAQIDDTFEVINDGLAGGLVRPNLIVENQVVIRNVVRSDLNSVLTCKAFSDNSTQLSVPLDISTSATLDIMQATLLTNETVSILRASRKDGGKYQCWAANVEGKSLSNALTLDVHYAPLCKAGQKRVYGASIGETVAVSCEVDSAPGQVMFFWLFNGTGGPDEPSPLGNGTPAVTSGDLATSAGSAKLKYASEGSRSWLYYTPSSRFEFGAFECWARNVIGRQSEPCVFHILPAGPPEAVHKCSLVNASTNQLVINCDPGYDGGLSQVFHLEVFDYRTSTLVSNVSMIDSPLFTIGNLEPDTSYLLVIYSTNTKGKSGRISLTSQTETVHRVAIVSTTESTGFTIDLTILGIVSGTVLTLLLVAVISVVLVRTRTNDERSLDEGSKDDKEMSSISNEDDLSPKAKLLPQFSSPTSPRNPDVIPSLAAMTEPRYEMDPTMMSSCFKATMTHDLGIHFSDRMSDDADSYGLNPDGQPLDIAALRYQDIGQCGRELGSDPRTRKYAVNVVNSSAVFRTPEEIRLDYLCRSLPRRTSLTEQDYAQLAHHVPTVMQRAATLTRGTVSFDQEPQLSELTPINQPRSARRNDISINGFSTPV
ncbi:Neural cell adhesion molecule 1 [Halotydeus destructor]|nr:Neural cell adhesion molecule 1 [Halotydeus destructor]